MTFQVLNVSDPIAYSAFFIICALGCVGAVVLRFVATHQSNRTAGAEDWFALVAVLVFLVRVYFELDCRISRLTYPQT